jgi:hypothetical protein
MQHAVRTALGAAVIVVCAACGAPSTPAPAPSTPPSPTSGAATGPQVPPAPNLPVSVPAGTSGVPRGAGPGVMQVNGADATAVGAAFATATFAFDAAIDVSPADAQRRSADFATPSFASELRQPLAQPGGERFTNLHAHHGYVTVALAENHDDGRPPDTVTTAARSWTVTSTGHSPDGWTAPMGDVLLFVSMTRSPSGPWQIASLQIPQAN